MSSYSSKYLMFTIQSKIGRLYENKKLVKMLVFQWLLNHRIIDNNVFYMYNIIIFYHIQTKMSLHRNKKELLTTVEQSHYLPIL